MIKDIKTLIKEKTKQSIYGVEYKSEAANDPEFWGYSKAIGGFLSKQPNGLYCYFSIALNYPVRYNINLKQMKIVNPKEEQQFSRFKIRPFTEVLKEVSFGGQSISEREFQEILIDMCLSQQEKLSYSISNKANAPENDRNVELVNFDFIAKQPNGLYCGFSRTYGFPIRSNLTLDDCLDGTVFLDDQEDIYFMHNCIQPFNKVLDSFFPSDYGLTQGSFLEVLVELSCKPVFDENN